MQLLQLVLRVVGLRHVHAVLDGARIGLDGARDHLEQRRLARAVGAHERDLVAAVHGEVEAVVHGLVAVALHETAGAHHLVARARRLLEVELDGFLLLGKLDALDLLELLHAILHLLGFRGLVAELLDERLHMGDLLGLLRRLGAQALQALLARFEVGRVVALVEVHLAVVHLGHAVHHVVHERAVVADHDDRARVAAQKALEPLHALQVEVVGGLVEQQHLGVADEQLRQRDTHLPAARELGGAAREVVLLEAQAEHDAAHLRLDGVAAQHLVGVADAPGGSKLLRRGGLAQLGLQLVQAALGFQHLHLRGHDLLEDGLVGHLDGLLLEVAHARALREQHATLVGILGARDDVEHSGLAGAVRAHERQALVFLQAERHVVEELAPSERLRDMFKLHDHGACALSACGSVRCCARRRNLSMIPEEAACGETGSSIAESSYIG